ncbi:MAG: pilus assembly protein PilM [Acidobacteriota bacterium]|nr:pilus assembly protein PilM [Acidobacteriota bacterium]
MELITCSDMGTALCRKGSSSTSMMRSKVGSSQELGEAISEALTRAGAEGASRVSVALPDTVARAFVVDFQDLPSAPREVENLIRWRLKKSVPFPLEQARLSWVQLGRGDDSRAQLLVALAPDEGLSVIENLVRAIGLRVGLIDLSSFSTFNALRVDGQLDDSRRGDTAVLSATPSYYSLIILRRGKLIFYRARSYHVQGAYQGEESLRVVARELRSSLSYYEEHLLGEGLARTLVRVVGIQAPGILQVARDAGCGEVVMASMQRAVAELQAAPDEDVPDLLPVVGLALRREP